jgi:hypothetical protein
MSFAINTNTTDKVVSIENTDEINSNPNFYLRSPNRGKIYRGPNWNAFNRESLGSIPRHTENILFKNKNNEQKLGFNSQSERFNKKSETIKYSFPGPGRYNLNSNSTTNTNTNVSLDSSISTNLPLTNPSFSTKGYGNGFISQSNRFDDKHEFYEKYYPGPGHYTNKTALSFDRELKNNKRYQSLYNIKESKSLKIFQDIPGPGFYNPIIPIELKHEMMDNENKHSFGGGDRFKELSHLKEKNNFPGPGKYSVYGSFVKNPDKTSFFFKNINPDESDDTYKFVKEDLINKYINTSGNEMKKSRPKKFSVPGPGEYNLYTYINNEGGNGNGNRNSPTIKKNLIPEKEKEIEKQKEKEIERINLMKSLKKENYSEYKSPFENNKKGISSVFLSHSPKEDYVRLKHVPGPTYYNPLLMPVKMNFNQNEDKLWI